MSDKYKVLFVCTANICRSPMAEVIFNELAEERSLNAVATSAGVRATSGHEMANNAREVLAEIGIVAGRHASRRATADVVGEVDLVLTMEHWHSDMVAEIADSGIRVFTLPEFTSSRVESEISDPYGLTRFAYRASVQQILGYTRDALDTLEREARF